MRAELAASDLVRELGLDDDDQPLGAGLFVGAGEHGDPAAAGAGELGDRVLELIREHVAPGPDHDVLGPAGDEQLARSDVPEVAGLEPSVVEQRAGRGVVVPITAGGRGPAKLDATERPFAELVATVVDDPDLVTRERAATGDKGDGVLGCTRDGAGLGGETPTIDAVDPGSAPWRREAQPHARFGQPVDRCQELAAKPIRPETIRESLEGARRDPFGAVERDPPGGQVQTVEVRRIDPSRAALVREVRPRGQRPAMAMNRPQPPLRPDEERRRRHDHECAGMVEAAQPGADEAHVVIERQPADEHVRRHGADRLAHRADVGQQVRVRQHNAFGVARAPRGVLQQGDVVGACGAQRQRVRGRELGGADHSGERGYARLQPRPDAPRGAVGDQQAGGRIAEDPGLASEVLLDLSEARGRIDRHRHRSREEHAEEDREELEAGRQHEGDRVSGGHAAIDEPAGDAARLGEQLGVSPCTGTSLVLEVNMHAAAMALGVPHEHVDQRPRVVGPRVGGYRGRRGDRREAAPVAGLHQRREQLAHGLRGDRLVFTHMRPGASFKAEQQLHSCEAADAQVALERAPWRDRHPPSGVELRDELTHDRESGRLEALAGIGPVL